MNYEIFSSMPGGNRHYSQPSASVRLCCLLFFKCLFPQLWLVSSYAYTDQYSLNTTGCPSVGLWGSFLQSIVLIYLFDIYWFVFLVEFSELLETLNYYILLFLENSQLFFLTHSILFVGLQFTYTVECLISFYIFCMIMIILVIGDNFH